MDVHSALPMNPSATTIGSMKRSDSPELGPVVYGLPRDSDFGINTKSSITVSRCAETAFVLRDTTKKKSLPWLAANREQDILVDTSKSIKEQVSKTSLAISLKKSSKQVDRIFRLFALATLSSSVKKVFGARQPRDLILADTANAVGHVFCLQKAAKHHQATAPRDRACRSRYRELDHAYFVSLYHATTTVAQFLDNEELLSYLPAAEALISFPLHRSVKEKVWTAAAISPLFVLQALIEDIPFDVPVKFNINTAFELAILSELNPSQNTTSFSHNLGSARRHQTGAFDIFMQASCVRTGEPLLLAPIVYGEHNMNVERFDTIVRDQSSRTQQSLPQMRELLRTFRFARKQVGQWSMVPKSELAS